MAAPMAVPMVASAAVLPVSSRGSVSPQSGGRNYNTSSGEYPRTPMRRTMGMTSARTEMPAGASAGIIVLAEDQSEYSGYPVGAVTMSPSGSVACSKMKGEMKEEIKEVTVVEESASLSVSTEKDYHDKHSGYHDGKGKKVADSWGWAVIVWLIFIFIIILVIVMAVFYYCKPGCVSKACEDGESDERELDLLWAGALAFFIAFFLILIIGGIWYASKR